VIRIGALLVIVAALAVAVVLGVLLVGSSPSQDGHAAGATARAPDVRVGRGRLGRMLVDGHGRTLYLFLKDRGGHSACTGRCARVWPPALVTAKPRAGAGVRRRLVATTSRGDARQLVYRGHPLYRMSADTHAGDMVGQGFLGTWFVVSPAGRRLGRAPHSAEGY
jgi:predicted lipoprotein with Yx(FWY)xxD motif